MRIGHFIVSSNKKVAGHGKDEHHHEVELIPRHDGSEDHDLKPSAGALSLTVDHQHGDHFAEGRVFSVDLVDVGTADQIPPVDPPNAVAINEQNAAAKKASSEHPAKPAPRK